MYEDYKESFLDLGHCVLHLLMSRVIAPSFS